MRGKRSPRHAADLWAHHHAAYRDPHQIVSQWHQATDIDPRLLQFTVRGSWWETLDQTGLTLLVTREYEHLVMALSIRQGRPHISFLHLPHPNGLAVDGKSGRVFAASTRNPNMIYEFAPCAGAVSATLWDSDLTGVLLPKRAHYLPGCLYL